MTTLKQILCAIINFGHPYEYKEWGPVKVKCGMSEIIYITRKECSCGKVWERKR
jgi:hypothetical protein